MRERSGPSFIRVLSIGYVHHSIIVEACAWFNWYDAGIEKEKPMSAPTSVRTRSPALPAIRFGGVVPASPLGSFMRWYDRYLQRCALAELDDRMLRDIGLTRRDVEREIQKPFWR
jgi:uncharacterized protein YjiS (DUF1127 family)